MRRSIERLRIERIDLLQIHNMAEVEHMLPVLREWKQEARIRYYGVTTSSTHQHEALARLVQREPLDFIQIDYALDNRAAEGRLLRPAVTCAITGTARRAYLIDNLGDARPRTTPRRGDPAADGGADRRRRVSHAR